MERMYSATAALVSKCSTLSSLPPVDLVTSMRVDQTKCPTPAAFHQLW